VLHKPVANDHVERVNPHSPVIFQDEYAMFALLLQA
jgi:hypothetical protein